MITMIRSNLSHLQFFELYPYLPFYLFSLFSFQPCFFCSKATYIVGFLEHFAPFLELKGMFLLLLRPHKNFSSDMK